MYFWGGYCDSDFAGQRGTLPLMRPHGQLPSFLNWHQRRPCIKYDGPKMKAICIICANAWALLGLLVYLGGHVERVDPDRLSFFGLGAWFEPATYEVIDVACFVIAAAWLIYSRKSAPGDR